MAGQIYSETSFTGANQIDNRDLEQLSGIKIVFQTGMPGTWKGYIHRRNGQRIPVESHISPVHDENGNLIGAVEVFRDISAHIALEQSHKQLLQLSRKDQLTGIYNRSAISEIIKVEIERSRRYHQALAVIMVDIDHFKGINDTYGHEAGDAVLAKIGSVMQYNLRKPDIVGRWGGEEFLIITPGSSARAAGNVAERIRKYIKAIEIENMPDNITASFGAAEISNDQSCDELILTADKAMYQAKQTGRDRVIIANTCLENSDFE